jgi:hypothetical protein
MDRDEAEGIIDDLVNRPGWTVTPSDLFVPRWLQFESDELEIKISYPTHETAIEEAPFGYPIDIRVNSFYLIELRPSMTRRAFQGILLECIRDANDHEVREFFRFKSEDYHAPFHPHHEAGQWEWRRLTGRDQSPRRLNP